MAQVPIFTGKVYRDGRMDLSTEQRPRRQEYLRGLASKIKKDETFLAVEVIVRKQRKQRSLDQNAYLHAVPFPILAEYFGDDIEGTKYSLMGECFGWRKCKITGREIPVKAHTSDMTDEECTYFIDWLIPWAMQKHGVEIPYPNEVAA